MDWKEPHLAFFLLLFLILELGFVGTAFVFAEPVLYELAWPAVLLGNLLAAAGMACYSGSAIQTFSRAAALWRRVNLEIVTRHSRRTTNKIDSKRRLIQSCTGLAVPPANSQCLTDSRLWAIFPHRRF